MYLTRTSKLYIKNQGWGAPGLLFGGGQSPPCSRQGTPPIQDFRGHPPSSVFPLQLVGIARFSLPQPGILPSGWLGWCSPLDFTLWQPLIGSCCGTVRGSVLWVEPSPEAALSLLSFGLCGLCPLFSSPSLGAIAFPACTEVRRWSSLLRYGVSVGDALPLLPPMAFSLGSLWCGSSPTWASPEAFWVHWLMFSASQRLPFPHP